MVCLATDYWAGLVRASTLANDAVCNICISKWAGKDQNCDDVFFGVECWAKDAEKSVSQGHRHGQARYFGILRSIEFTIRILVAQFP
jgi:hypothetical protein